MSHGVYLLELPTTLLEKSRAVHGPASYLVLGSNCSALQGPQHFRPCFLTLRSDTEAIKLFGAYQIQRDFSTSRHHCSTFPSPITRQLGHVEVSTGRAAHRALPTTTASNPASSAVNNNGDSPLLLLLAEPSRRGAHNDLVVARRPRCRRCRYLGGQGTSEIAIRS